ncbi:MAG: hypothetical protein K6B14_02910 [Lachnospiraceae bacterium]|nr:hypothetical protein [Lachnospiraceae bacterium]
MSDLDFMQKSQKQLDRKRSITRTLDMDKMNELYMNDGQPQFVENNFLDKTQIQHDAIGLGAKKTWKPSEEQKAKNEKIDKAHQLTKLATADTEMIQKITAESAKWKIDGDDAFRFLMSTTFDARMLTSANIRANFGDYMRIVRCYERVREFNTMGDMMGFTQRFAQIKDDAELFYNRMIAYIEANRVDIKGNILADNVEASTFEIDHESIRKGTVMRGNPVDDYQGDLSKIDTDKVQKILETEEVDKEFIWEDMKAVAKEELRGTFSLNQGYRYDGYKKFEYMGNEQGKGFLRFKDYDTAESRINEIVDMRVQLRFLRTAQTPGTLINAQMTYMGNAAHKQEMLKAMAREELELTARLVLAEAEARYAFILDCSNADPEEVEALKKEVEDAWQDYRKIQIRMAKESMPLTAKGIGNSTMTRGEAISSDSDAANMAFKKRVSDAGAALDANIPLLKTVRDLASIYSGETHYTIGCDTEASVLRDLKAAIKAASDGGYANDPNLQALQKEIAGLDKSYIISFDLIPDELKMDFSGKTLKEVSGDKSDPGSTRNAFMNNDLMREWIDVKDMPIFPHEPTINDLRQGKISNCYMLAATTSLIQHDPQAIKNIIHDNGDGTATVRLYKEIGKPVFIRVDKVVPRLKTGGAIMSSGPLWMQLIEMAAAHVGMFKKGISKGKQIDKSGIGTLWYGTGAYWFAMLTGSFDHTTVAEGGPHGPEFPAEGVGDKEALFKSIRDAKKQGFIYHLGTKGSTSAGLNSGHAYTVLGAKEVDGVKYVTLRNPYANMSYQRDEKGDETMSSTYFSSVADSTCGQFDIPLDELLDNIESITRTNVNTDRFMAAEKDIFIPENGKQYNVVKAGPDADDLDLTIAQLTTIALNDGYVPGLEPKEIEFLDEDELEDDSTEDELTEEVKEEVKEEVIDIEDTEVVEKDKNKTDVGTGNDAK